MSLLRRVFFVGVAVFVVSTCGGGGDGMGPPTLTSVTITGDSTVVLNGVRTLTAQALAGNAAVVAGVTYTWSTSDPGVATITSSGSFVNIGGVSRGTVTITVQATTSAQPSGPSATHQLRVRIGSIFLGASPPPTMTSINDTLFITAEARDANNVAVPGVSFTWQAATGGVVTLQPVTTTQVRMIAQGNGSTQVTATGDAVSQSTTATVAQVATTLSVTPDTTTFDQRNAFIDPAVTATDARGNAVPTSAIAWSTSNSGVASVSATTGRITSEGEGQARVVAMSGSLTDTVRVGVALVYGSVNIVSDTTIRRLNGTRQMVAQVRDAGNTLVPGPQVTWALKTGTIASISAGGLVTGNTQTGTDSVIVTARTVADTALLTVIQVTALVDVTPDAPEALHFVGDQQQFAAVAKDSGLFDIPGKTFTWSSSNSAVVDVDPATGLASAVINGTARVRGTVDGKTDSVAITVQRIPYQAFLSPNSFPTLTALGQGVVATCVVQDSSAISGDSAVAIIGGHFCNWTAAVGGVISFSPNPASSTTITAVANGSTGITATAAASVFGQNFVQVQQVAATIKLHPLTIDTSRILVNTGTFQMVDSAFDANGFRVPGSGLTWSSTNGGAASVSSSGLVTAGASTGNTFIKAASGTAADSALVVVTSTGTSLAGGVQPIFTSCASSLCHGGVTPREGMNLTSGQSRANIVNIGANQSVLDRAEPGQPDFSYLVHKIQGTHLLPPANGSGVRMPEGCSGATCLTRGEINTIRNWILQGALNN